jgi:hypothetical protein
MNPNILKKSLEENISKLFKPFYKTTQQVEFLNFKGNTLEETYNKLIVDARIFDITNKEKLNAEELNTLENKIAELKWQREKGYTAKVIADTTRKLSAYKVNTTIDILTNIVNKQYDNPQTQAPNKAVADILAIAKGETNDRFYDTKLTAMNERLQAIEESEMQLSGQEILALKEAHMHLQKNSYLKQKANKNEKTQEQLHSISELIF